MRKLLLSSTALVTTAASIVVAAVSDVSISTAKEQSYSSRSSNLPANHIIAFGQNYEIVFNFTNKTDTDLNIGYTVELESDATKSASYIDESLLSISAGFGKIVLGSNNVFDHNYGIEAEDAVVK